MVNKLSKEQRKEHKDDLMKDGAQKLSLMAESVSQAMNGVLEKVWLWNVFDDVLDDVWYDMLFDGDGQPKRWVWLFLDKKKLAWLATETITQTKADLDNIKEDIYKEHPSYGSYKALIAKAVNIFANSDPKLPAKKRVNLLAKENAHPPSLDAVIGDKDLLTWWKKTAIGQVFPAALKDAQNYLKKEYNMDVPWKIEDLSLEQQFLVSAAYIHKLYKETGNRKEAVLRYHIGTNGKPKNDQQAQKYAQGNPAILRSYNENHKPQTTAETITADQYREWAIAYYELA